MFSLSAALIVAAFLFTGSASVGAEEIKEINHIFPGITHIHIQSTRLPESNPRLLNINILEVDVHDDHIRFFVTPGNGDAPLDCTAQTTSNFLSTWGAQAAVDGDFWNVKTAFCDEHGCYRDVMSLAVSDGVKYSDPGFLPFGPPRTALAFSQDGDAHIGRGDSLLALGVYNAVGGNKMLLKEGQIHSDAWVGGGAKYPNPRTSVGLSEDGEMLFLAVVDGRQPGFSDGVTLPEMAELLREWGAYTATNLDGGGSSTMVVEDAEGYPQVLNSPSGGAERAVANHLGIFVLSDTDPGDDDEGSSKSVAPVPGGFSLSQNNPNPFNPSTAIAYELPKRSQVRLTIYNVHGQRIATLVDREQSAGYHTVMWDAAGMSAGVYLCRMEAGDYHAVRKMLLVR